MEFIHEENNGSIFLKIVGALSICEAAALHDELAACLDKYKGLALDLGEVSECDAAGIQLVCSARMEAAAADKSFGVSRASPPVAEAFLRAGLKMDDFQILEKEKSDG